MKSKFCQCEPKLTCLLVKVVTCMCLENNQEVTSRTVQVLVSLLQVTLFIEIISENQGYVYNLKGLKLKIKIFTLDLNLEAGQNFCRVPLKKLQRHVMCLDFRLFVHARCTIYMHILPLAYIFRHILTIISSG